MLLQDPCLGLEHLGDRLDNLKHQAQAQAEATRKAAATAAWWLFATAVTSGTAAAIAGALAVVPRVVG